MAAELGLVSLTKLQQLLQPAAHRPQSDTGSSTSTVTSSSRMWNPNPSPQQPRGALLEEEDDSWEVRAFAEDTGNIMGTTWPPRSYTCTFCQREFRSAQALGGHMNVHRRDRARLHQTQYPPRGRPGRFPPIPSSTVPTPAPLVISNQDLVSQGGLCLLYQLPNTGSFFGDGTINNSAHSDHSPAASTLVSASAYYNQPNIRLNNDSPHHSEAETDSSSFEGSKTMSGNDMHKESSPELDLELRLGPRPTPF